MSNAVMNKPGPWARDIERFINRVGSVSDTFDFVYAGTSVFSSSPHSVLVSFGYSTDPDCEETEIEFYFYAGRLVVVPDTGEDEEEGLPVRKQFNTYKEAVTYVEDILSMWSENA